MKLKVCGMKLNTAEVAKLRPDYLGFIFYENSPRHFEGNMPELTEDTQKVGVFVDAKREEVLAQVEKNKLDMVQLHGNETPEFCKLIKEYGVEVIKVFSIKDTFNFEVLLPYEEVCDFFLFDTKGKLPGGNGYTFNWNVMQQYPSKKPFFLSGGIGLGQIDKLQEFKKSKAAHYCYAIDVNSQFEIQPGLKNIEQLKKFKSQL